MLTTQLNDTHPEVEKMLIFLLRRISFAKKFDQMLSFSSTIIKLSKRAIARANPNLTKQEHDILFVKYHYSNELAATIQKYFDKHRV
ncbi:MAG: hypothetical protein M0Q21_10395 [Ignavibacteriaceae bacterium]|jgi:hypothetical protein|nr:hypothetical protein [Ignavibacteriaceae bacterium]